MPERNKKKPGKSPAAKKSRRPAAKKKGAARPKKAKETPRPANTFTPAELAALLTANGRAPITEANILADVQAGAPANPDGTVHLIRYAAWLVKQAAE